MPRVRARLASITPLVQSADLRTARIPPKSADPFYLSPEWRGMMLDLVRKRGRLCQECGRAGTRIFGDHVVELRDGGDPLDPMNVRLLCGSCHTRKTNAARAERMATHY